MKKLYAIALFSLLFGLVFLADPQPIAAQDKPAPTTKEKKQEVDDDDDDEDLTAADKASVKITLEAARAIALKRVPGKVIDEELEKEKGRLQYAFDIRDANGKVFDVEVDAMTGEILQAIEDDDDDDGDDDNGRSKTVVKKKIVEATSKTVTPKP